MVPKTDSPTLVKKLFDFLQKDYGFDLIKEKSSNSGIFFVYQNKYSKVGISFDYRDNFLYVDLIRGSDTMYPNEPDLENIKPLIELIRKYDPNYDINKLKSDSSQYFEALNNNAEMLKRYGEKFFKGEEWI